MNAREREIVAYHEAGHALVATALPGLDPVHKISIVQRGFGALGYTMQLPLEDEYLMTAHRSAPPARRPARRAHGRGDRARRDLDRRPERPAARHGHRPRDGHRVGHERRARRHQLRRRQARAFLDIGWARSAAPTRRKRRRLIDAEVKRIMTEAHDSARRMLTEQREQLEAVTRRLLERRGDGRRRIAADPGPAGPGRSGPAVGAACPGQRLIGGRARRSASFNPARPLFHFGTTQPRTSDFAFG